MIAIIKKLEIGNICKQPLDKFGAPMRTIEHYGNCNNEFRNCQNTWLHDNKVNNFLAISNIEMLGICDEHHGFMVKNKSCFLVNRFVWDLVMVEILI